MKDMVAETKVSIIDKIDEAIKNSPQNHNYVQYNKQDDNNSSGPSSGSLNEVKAMCSELKTLLTAQA